MSPALMGGICLAYQGPLTFLPEGGTVLQIDWDKGDLPTLTGINKVVLSELIKSVALGDVISSVAVGCLVPEINCLNDDTNGKAVHEHASKLPRVMNKNIKNPHLMSKRVLPLQCI